MESDSSTAQRSALLELGRHLQAAGYRFITVSPETHRRVNARAPAPAANLRDAFGWSRPFPDALLPPQMLAALAATGVVVRDALGWQSTVRFSTLEDMIFAHSAYPTVEPDAVFFGPDTYRFCSFIQAEAPAARRVVDVGCGSGAGGMVAARAVGAETLVLADVNHRALHLASVNAALLRTEAACMRDVQLTLSDVLRAVAGDFDLVVANPPYMRDEAGRVYRDGGGAFGEALAVRIARESLDRLTAGGTLLLYTGAAIVEGEDTFLQAVKPVLLGARCSYSYRELDPDVFGEELDRPGYAQVERIAAVGLIATRL